MPPGRLRVLLLVPEASDDALAAGLVRALAAACGDAIDVERLAPASENALRERLAAAPADVVHLVGSGRCNAAARYATLNLAGSDGGPRAVSASHFGTLLAGHAGLAVLQMADAAPFAATPWVADLLCAQGVPAAVVAARGSDPVAAASRFYAALACGEPLAAAAAALGCAAQTVSAAHAATPVSPAPTPRPATAAGGEPTPPAEPAPADTARERREREARARLAQKRAAGEFDVFLCHNGIDKPAVKRIAEALKAHGILPWLDEWELPPGQPWQPLLEQQISRIRAAAVFVGDAGVGPWQQQELYGFLREFVSRNAPVIPVLLPGAAAEPKLPIFLQAMTWVKFGQPEPAPLPRLIWGITGERPEDY